MSEADVRTIVVPLDGSERAASALRVAGQLAESLDAELVLLTARREAEDLEDASEYLDMQAALVEPKARALVVTDEEATAAILHAAREPGALVCMTTHGRGGVPRAVLGSVAEDVVRGSDGPVVLVGPWIRSDWTLPAEPTLLAGFDGTVPARAGVRAAGDVAASLGGRVRVVEMSRLPDVLSVSRFPVGHVDGLEDAVDELRSTGVEADYQVVDGVDAADTLIAEAVRTGAAMLALGTHGRRGAARLALGSVATRVVRHATVPVLVAHPRP